MRGKALSCGVLILLGTAAACVVPGTAHARKTYCCVNGQGRNVCGDILPQECYGRAHREVSEHGVTLRHIDAPLTAGQRAQRDAEKEIKRQEAIAAKELQRQNEALLNTYANEKDVDFMRDRALGAVSVAAKEVEAKYAEALKRKKKLEDELEFYMKKPAPGNLKEQVKINETELKTLQAAVEAKKQEMAQVTARFAEEKKRFLELKEGGGARKTSSAPASIKPR